MGRYFGTASAKHSNGRIFEYQIPQGYHVPHCVGNPHWRIPNSSVIFFSNRYEVLLVSEEFVMTEELGIRQCGLPTNEEHDSPEELEPQIGPLMCYSPAVQNILPPNGHIL